MQFFFPVHWSNWCVGDFIHLRQFDAHINQRYCVPFTSVWPTTFLSIFRRLGPCNVRSIRCSTKMFVCFHDFFVRLLAHVNSTFRRWFLLIRVRFWLTKHHVFLVVEEVVKRRDKLIKKTFFLSTIINNINGSTRSIRGTPIHIKNSLRCQN